MARKQSQFQCASFPPIFLLFLVTLIVVSTNVRIVRVAEGGGGKRVQIPDELDDVIDDEEDEDWKNWGKKKKPKEEKFDPPSMDLTNMELPEIQAEMMKRHTGPSFGFVKLQFGVRRTPEMVSEIAMKWTKILKTGSMDAKFMGVDVSTIMFTLEKGQDAIELKEFVLGQPDAYEVKIGDQTYRRDGDPPVEEVIEMLRNKKQIADDKSAVADPDLLNDEL